jgi:tRNA modification GTPase
MYVKEETIAAIATPPGTGGISIVRVSGPDAVLAAGKTLRLRSGAPLSSVRPWTVRLASVVDREGVTIDEALVLVMRGPRSYTGEDLVEVQCHGGSLVSQKVLASVLEAGARHAEPGEFTRRAFLNGRITLEEAEAVLEVVNAPTEYALSQAGRRLRGELGARVRKWETRLYSALAALQASADFPEDVDEVSSHAMEEVLSAHKEIAALLDRAPLGLALSCGIEVCLVGPPNAGKSSLFNALLAADRAIVTEVPGTTRDVLRETTEWDGLPVILLDTAGLRQTSDVVEIIGVERAERAASESEVIIYVFDSALGLGSEDRDWIGKWLKQGRRVLLVAGKSDAGACKVSESEINEVAGGAFVLASAVTGAGLEEIKKRVTDWFRRGQDPRLLSPGSARQVDCLRRASSSLGEALSRRSEGWTEDVVVLCLEEALEALAELTGKDVSEETLEQVFARFCVGK